MIQQIAPIGVKNLLQTGHKIILLDVRETWENTISALPESVLIPLGTLPAKISTLSKEDEYVIYCHHGVRSFKACLLLRSNGFKNVRNLAGGIAAWSEIDPTIKKY
jgi:rhodanese-related sulfurtransferase